MHMKNKLSPATIIAAIILLLIGLWALPVSILGIYLDETNFSGSLSVLISEIILFVTGILAILQIISAIFIFKKRRWAHILGIVVAIIIMMSSLIHAGGNYIITGIYLLVLILLMAGTKDFKKA